MTTSYGQFCPIAMAAEVVCSRWTVLVIRELLNGSTRFNDLRRGLARMSPSLLSKRLKELERSGVVKVIAGGQSGVNEYHITDAGLALRPLILALGNWGAQWVEETLPLRNLDPTLLMWDMHRSINADPFPAGRSTIQFVYPELPNTHRDYWLVVDDGVVDICWVDPGFEIDLWVSSPLNVMTAVWMGYISLTSEITAGRIQVDGDPRLARSMPIWLGLSLFAKKPAQPAVQGPAT